MAAPLSVQHCRLGYFSSGDSSGAVTEAFFFMAPATVVVTTHVVDPMAQSSDASQSIEDDEPATQSALIASRDVAALVLKELPPPPAPVSHNWHHFLCEHGVRMGCIAGTETASNSADVIDRQIDGLLASVTVEPVPRSRVLTVTAKPIQVNGRLPWQMRSSPITRN